MSEFNETLDNFDNFSISTFGNVKNNTTDRILKPTMDQSGYLRIGLIKNSPICPEFAPCTRSISGSSEEIHALSSGQIGAMVNDMNH